MDYWQKSFVAANPDPSRELLNELIYLDGRMWLTKNTSMLWRQGRLTFLSATGERTGQKAGLNPSCMNQRDGCK
jgi:hypothetical protein